MEMVCEEKARLIEEHHQASLVYSRAARALNGTRGTLPASEYVKLRAAADEARIKTTETSLAVERRIAEHGC
jgi:hypothetical protein